MGPFTSLGDSFWSLFGPKMSFFDQIRVRFWSKSTFLASAGSFWDRFWSHFDLKGFILDQKGPKITLIAPKRVPKGGPKDPEMNPFGSFWVILAPFELNRVLFDPKVTFLDQNPLHKLPFWLHFRYNLGSQNDPLGPSLAGWPPSRCSSSSSSLPTLAGGFRVHRNYVKMQLKSSRA